MACCSASCYTEHAECRSEATGTLNKLEKSNNRARPPFRVPGAMQQYAQAAPHKAGACRMPPASGQVNLVLALLNPPLATDGDRNINDVGLKPVSIFLRDALLHCHGKEVAGDDDGKLVDEDAV